MSGPRLEKLAAAPLSFFDRWSSARRAEHAAYLLWNCIADAGGPDAVAPQVMDSFLAAHRRDMAGDVWDAAVARRLTAYLDRLLGDDMMGSDLPPDARALWQAFGRLYQLSPAEIDARVTPRLTILVERWWQRLLGVNDVPDLAGADVAQAGARLLASFGLPAGFDTAIRAAAVQTRAEVEWTLLFEGALSGRLPPEDRRYVEELMQRLHSSFAPTATELRKLDVAERLYRLEDEELVAIDIDLPLQAGEIAYLQCPARRAALKSVEVTEAEEGHDGKEDRWVDEERGTLYVTSQRIVFVAAESTTVPWSDVTALNPGTRIEIRRASGPALVVNLSRFDGDWFIALYELLGPQDDKD